jgi:hypothetical protein
MNSIFYENIIADLLEKDYTNWDIIPEELRGLRIFIQARGKAFENFIDYVIATDDPYDYYQYCEIPEDLYDNDLFNEKLKEKVLEKISIKPDFFDNFDNAYIRNFVAKHEKTPEFIQAEEVGLLNQLRNNFRIWDVLSGDLKENDNFIQAREDGVIKALKEKNISWELVPEEFKNRKEFIDAAKEGTLNHYETSYFFVSLENTPDFIKNDEEILAKNKIHFMNCAKNNRVRITEYIPEYLINDSEVFDFICDLWIEKIKFDCNTLNYIKIFKVKTNPKVVAAYEESLRKKKEKAANKAARKEKKQREKEEHLKKTPE